jgi:hypothetical protein
MPAGSHANEQPCGWTPEDPRAPAVERSQRIALLRAIEADPKDFDWSDRMGTHLHLASSLRASQSSPALGFLDDAAIARISEQVRGAGGRSVAGGVSAGYPLLERIGDPYKDARFAGSELQSLAAEVRTLLEEPSVRAEVAPALAMLLRVCLDGLARQLDLYCWCD